MLYLIRFSEVIRERKILVYVGVYILCLWTAATLVFNFFEDISFFDSFYWAISTTTTVGYGDVVAKTVAEKITSIIVKFSGIGIMGLFLATFIEILIEKSLNRRKPIRSLMKGHIIVGGWNKTLEIAVRELLSENKEVVVVAEVDDIPLENENLIFIKGDLGSDANLQKANIAKASSALISGNDDTEALLSAIAVETLNRDVHTTCIVSDPKVIQALKKPEPIRSCPQKSSLVLYCQGPFSCRISQVS